TVSEAPSLPISLRHGRLTKLKYLLPPPLPLHFKSHRSLTRNSSLPANLAPRPRLYIGCTLQALHYKFSHQDQGCTSVVHYKPYTTSFHLFISFIQLFILFLFYFYSYFCCPSCPFACFCFLSFA